MVPSRLAFLQEFERELSTRSLGDWYAAVRKQEPVLEEFIDPSALRVFLQTDERDPRKPQAWRALVRGFHSNPEPARLFVVGLLDPALDHLMHRFAGDDLDPEDLWQETITCALAALSNPKLPNRRAVLAGMLLDTFHQLRHWLRRELSRARNTGPLLDVVSIPSPFEAEDSSDAEELLAEICRRAGVTREGFALILLTRIRQRPLADLAPHLSATYFRLSRRRAAAEKQVGSWLTAHSDWHHEMK